ncbi:MAG: hypothetical protein OEV61_03935 [Chloroflexota bacterium]|nr:hypothetical protein [Chloroflexota bacterium]MDH5242975.1 hypothetical protein [Chloroflexota bacterium]
MRLRAVVIGTAIGVAAGVGVSRARRWWKSWGVDPGEAWKTLPGDDIVADPVAVDTRGITIDAPPSTVWPWLVQMGYGRAGWYSYDRLDQRGKSVEEIVDDWQSLAVGDIVPTHPTGGFEVAELDSGHALVLRSDTDLVMAQAAAASTAGTEDKGTAGVQVSGAMLGGTPQDFSASWAFVLEPMDGGRTRLIERFRVWFGPAGPGRQLLAGPLLGFGVFVMMERQMRGIRDRAERLAATGGVPVTRVASAPEAGEATTEAPPEPVGIPG